MTRPTIFQLAMLAAVSLLLATIGEVFGVVTLPYPGVSGTTIKASEYNANFNTVINALNDTISDVSVLDSQLPTQLTLTAAGGTEELLASGSRIDLGTATCSAVLRAEYTANDGTNHMSGVIYQSCSVDAATTTAVLMLHLRHSPGAAADWDIYFEAGTGGTVKMWASGTAGVKWKAKVTPVSQGL